MNWCWSFEPVFLAGVGVYIVFDVLAGAGAWFGVGILVGALGWCV